MAVYNILPDHFYFHMTNFFFNFIGQNTSKWCNFDKYLANMKDFSRNEMTSDAKFKWLTTLEARVVSRTSIIDEF